MRLAALASAAGQLGAVGRQLGSILSNIVSELRAIKKPWGEQGKLAKVYDLVFGMVVSFHGRTNTCMAVLTRAWPYLHVHTAPEQPALGK